MKINDLTSLFFLHDYVKNGKVSKRRRRQGAAFLKRFERNPDWYQNVTFIKKFKEILNKLINYLEKD
ncbi:hypothetical protein M8332_04940 [Fructilactobacillus ixorae]|uniref:Uncharacterized protein n=1 Tax=Fructilactobacillus ixorae TaxID=1750535 RepID=A0ABY5C6N1_9LACO|nr:hypothetical protein [Fructilactobacillus ixorae]USS92956.1 hypothetical protein M8332_04940 [Fructilactobacillus ixorae]